ncbi:Edc3p [Kluyveromyces lactis]|uniref:Enhancer of mRNA-decapping protein 3 n=2 Tax=Kluyveromyces lactis (strain ATCC 8585 / CBS 2359 / DSM 70799 / NBRC 1267 / NRRL Y-1140 / WM37) TaxID=284590 RepID=Q6CX48_KLULA|nr:uncharacterized protein KLLA0_A11308g [Kluyveromyces lactis]CAH03079.1 KLLA0A11308p [Kluyveromyces lactis]|eukprot:XP_451491.1 uncharacterized protein KLLA0_A11308g [Kluyveromyces lactis]
MLNFKGYQIEIELKDGKRITGTLKQVSPKSLTLTDAVFQDGGVSPVFKIKADKLYDLKVLKLPPNANVKMNNGNGNGNGNGKQEKEKEKGKERDRFTEKADEIWDTEMSSDFDFQGNLQRFNKKDAFKDFQNVEIPKDETKIPHNEMVTAGNVKETTSDSDKITESINITHLLRNDSIAASLANQRKTFTCGSKNKIKVPLATPIQLLEMEKIADEKFMLPLKTSLEHSGIHISRLLRNMLKSYTPPATSDSDAVPTVVAFVSGGRSGSRCISALRCLLYIKDIRCIIVNPFINERESFDDDISTEQINKIKTLNNVHFPDSLAKLKELLQNEPPSIIIDALQGFDDTVSDLDFSPDSNDNIAQYIKWINSHETVSACLEVISFDCPAHIDPSSGDVIESDFVHPTTILSTGWPLHCLPKLTQILPDWRNTYVYDTGVPQQTYLLKPNLRKFYKLDIYPGFSGTQELK